MKDYIKTIKTSILFYYHRHYWLKETKFLSNPDKITNNKHYKAIKAMGLVVVPFLISDMKRNGNHWFAALEKITTYNPVQPEHAGQIDKMIEDWVKWWARWIWLTDIGV